MSPRTVRSPPTPEGIARDVLDSLLEGCQVIGFDWTYLYVNDTVVAQSGRTRQALLGQTMMACHPGIEETPMFAVLRRCMAERRHERLEHEHTLSDGSMGWCELRFIPVPDGTCIFSFDITPTRRASAALARTEEQLWKAQKLEAIGQMAGGIAHDFNNLLSVILRYAHLMLEDLRPLDPMREDLQEILKASERAADLTRQLLAFSRRQIVQPRIVDLNDVVARMENMIRRLVGADVVVRTVLAGGLGRVRTDPGHVEQVVMNLVVNARDAMPTGGVLTLATQEVEVDEATAAQHAGMTAGPHVILSVSDTGVGMDKAVQDRIFEPFFTSKERGRGTGLGLSTVFGIVRQSSGSVWVQSELGRGSTFKIYLPRTDELPPTAAADAPAATLTGTETVLLVGGEDQVRNVARSVLGRQGYRVLDARSGGEALLLSEKHAGPIHLLLTEVVMPHLSGRELAERLLPARPEMRVVYLSGDTSDAIARHQVVSPGEELLQKPLTPQSLLTRVRQVLDGVRSVTAWAPRSS